MQYIKKGEAIVRVADDSDLLIDPDTSAVTFADWWGALSEEEKQHQIDLRNADPSNPAVLSEEELGMIAEMMVEETVKEEGGADAQESGEEE